MGILNFIFSRGPGIFVPQGQPQGIWHPNRFGLNGGGERCLRAIFSKFQESKDSQEISIFFYFATTCLWLN